MGRRRVDYVERYDFITTEATDRSQARTHKERLYFDYFNPNGAWKQHCELMDEVAKLVEAGKVRSGLLLAYDAEYYRKNLARLAMRNCSCSAFDSRYHGDQIREVTEKLRKAVDEQLAG